MKTDNRGFLTAVFVTALVFSNILSSKLIVIGSIAIPGGIFCYAITCLVADVIGELYARAQSRSVLIYGFVCQAMCSALIALTLLLPAADVHIGDAFNIALGSSWWFTIASLIAYLLSQTVDIAVFHGIREKLIVKGSRHRWIWNKASTVISQAIDTAVYIIIAFGFGLGLIWDGDTRLTLINIMAMQYLIKVVLAAIDTPFFYLLTRRKRNE